MKYDAQSKHYVLCEDPAEATTCSICMEFLGKQVEQFRDFVLKPLLSTIFNRIPVILQYLKMTL